MDIKPFKRAYKNKKINKQMLDAILHDIRSYSTNKHAAQANGMGEVTFYEIVLQGALDLDYGEDSMEAYFTQSLSRIKQDEIKMHRRAIIVSDKGHRGAEWSLEHAYQREFSPNFLALDAHKRLEELEKKAMMGGEITVQDVDNVKQAVKDMDSERRAKAGIKK